MDEHVYKSHNKTLLMYHLVFPVKYRRKVFTSEVEASLKEICLGIEARYEMRFIEIGLEEDHVDLLVQGLPTMAVNEIVRIIKSLTAREIFKRYPKIRSELPKLIITQSTLKTEKLPANHYNIRKRSMISVVNTGLFCYNLS